MTEREIREVLRELCEELDRSARRVVRKVVMPAALGAGLALSAGACGDRAVNTDSTVGRPDMAYGVPLYGVPDDWRIPANEAAYMTPFDRGVPRDLKKQTDPGAIPPYMAPLDKGLMKDKVPPPQPDYMVPDDAGGAVPLYTMPMPDLKKSPG